MAKKIQYSGKDKKFLIKKSNLKLRKELFYILLILLAMVFFAVAFNLITFSTNLENSTKAISYSEKGSSNYKVYLKENSYYNQSYIAEDMELITDLINTINLDYNYQIHSTEEFNYNYSYKITTNLEITDNNDTTKVLFKNNEVLFESEELTAKENSLIINKDIDLEYAVYDQYVKAFKNDNEVSVAANLFVNMEVSISGANEKIEKDLEKNNKLTVAIPLNERTMKIDTTKGTLDEPGFVSDMSGFAINNYVLFVLACITALGFVVTVGYLIFIIVKDNKSKDIYISTVRKYLKEYDRIIVNSRQPDLNEKMFKNKIRVMSIEELVDAYDSTASPIIYYEVIPNEKSYFIIMHDLTLYKLTISRAYLERDKEQ